MGIGGYVVVTVGILLLCYFVPILVRRRQALISSHVHDRVSPHLQVIGRLDQIIDQSDQVATEQDETHTSTRLLASKKVDTPRTVVNYQRLPRVSASRTVKYAPRYAVEKTEQLGVASRTKLREIMLQRQYADARYNFARNMRRLIAVVAVIITAMVAAVAYLQLLPWWVTILGGLWLGLLYWRGRRAKQSFVSSRQKAAELLQLVASGKLEHKIRVQALTKQGAKARFAAHKLEAEPKADLSALPGKKIEIASSADNITAISGNTNEVTDEDAVETTLINTIEESDRAWQPVKVPAPLYTLQKTPVARTYIPYVAEEHLAANEQADAEVAERGKAPQRPKRLSAYYQKRAAEFAAQQAQTSSEQLNEQIADSSANFTIDLEDILAKRRASA